MVALRVHLDSIERVSSVGRLRLGLEESDAGFAVSAPGGSALRCYPQRWRSRHGEEAAEIASLLIRDGTPAQSIAWSYLMGAARTRLVLEPRRRLGAAVGALLLAAGSLGVPLALLSSSAPANAASVIHSRPAQPRPAVRGTAEPWRGGHGPPIHPFGRRPANRTAVAGMTTADLGGAPEDLAATPGARRAASVPRARRRRRGAASWPAGPSTLALALLLAFGVRTFVFQAFSIPTTSMVPTLDVDDRILVQKAFFNWHQLRQGDIVVFTHPPRDHCPGPQRPTWSSASSRCRARPSTRQAASSTSTASGSASRTCRPTTRSGPRYPTPPGRTPSASRPGTST